jgi:MFS family permease
VASLSITETVSWVILYYGFPVMLQPMETGLGYSRVQLTGALSIGFLTSALAALPVGRWIDRHGARGRHRARGQRRPRHCAVRGRAPAGGARRLRARVLAPGGGALLAALGLRAAPSGVRNP